MRAELSATEGRPILWAARLSPHATTCSPTRAPALLPSRTRTRRTTKCWSSCGRRRWTHCAHMRIGVLLRVPPAEGLAERVRTACFDRSGNRWPLCLNSEHIESVAYAFHLRSMGGSVTEANRFAREYGVAFRLDRSTKSLRLTRLC
ncbi:DUF6417 family protein [Streptomyces sp. NPDC001792]|uniref:DUF6417 family protein n=1 Tax=Streptomyces sp. NPDC001792 TaxID=3154524 RepID=UPI00331779D3